MEYAQTIAMARNLLADGRAEDVVRMVEPLLNASDADEPATAFDRAPLHALLARVHVVHTGDVERALALLALYEETATRRRLSDPVRANVALWLGWAHARRDTSFDEEARALNLLDEARRCFDEQMDIHGRCWAHIGRAQAYFTIDEYQLMREALEEATALQRTIRDTQADRWIHDLSVSALRFQGRYDDAQAHVDALMTWGSNAANQEVQGRAYAYQAALYLDQGYAPERIVSTAERAETLLLRRSSSGVGYPLLAAYHAHIRALMLQGAWDEATAKIDEALDTVGPSPTARAHLQTLRARLAIRQQQPDRAEAIMEDLFEHAHHLPHGLQRSHVALLRGELLAQSGHHEDALTWMQRAYRNARETGHRGNQLLALLALTETAMERGDLTASAEYLRQSEQYDDYFSVLPFAADRFRVLGRHAQQHGRTDEARSSFDQSLSAYSLIGDAYRSAELQRTLATLDGASPARARSFLEAAATTFEKLGADEEAAATRAHLDTLPTDDTTTTTFETKVGAALARASLSTRLVAEAWIQAVEEVLPGRWIGVYRRTPGDAWTCLHERGTPPADLAFPTPCESPQFTGNALWLPLDPSDAFDFYMGLTATGPEDPAWQAAAPRLEPWLPVVQMALDRALLHRNRIDDALSTNGTAATKLLCSVDELVYDSTAMRAVAQKIDRMRSSHSPVLITGATGVGKTAVARAIHASSERHASSWRAINCASVPPDPLEIRLFGGADAGAGLLRQADGGTLLLKEIGALPRPLQTRLLRVLEKGEASPTGAEDAVPVDVRLVASTSEDLAARVREGHFREDLYYRLNVISLSIPPLRERREDIPVLVQHFLDTLRPAATPPVSITNRALDAMRRYDWPGNVRQLRNEVERVLAFISSEPAPTVDLPLLSESIQVGASHSSSSSLGGWADIIHPDRDLSDMLARTEKEIIERVLAECDGQITASADMLGLTRQGLYKKMKRLEIDPATFKRNATTSAVAN